MPKFFSKQFTLNRLNLFENKWLFSTNEWHQNHNTSTNPVFQLSFVESKA